MTHFVGRVKFPVVVLQRRKGDVSRSCDAVDFGSKKRNWEKKKVTSFGQISRDSSLGLKMLFARAVTTVICSISPALHFQTFSFSETGSLMLLWPYWACANTAQGNSIKRQHLLWVYPTERTETRLHFFLFVCLFVIFSWFCYVAG